MGTDKLKNSVSILFLFMLMIYISAQQNLILSTKKTMGKQAEDAFNNRCKAGNKSTEINCKLTTAALRERKETVIARLKQHVMEKRELKNGYAFKFPGTDNILDELTEFIKTERACCDFFIFGISVSGDKSEAWLELTGANNIKNFITAELGL